MRAIISTRTGFIVEDIFKEALTELCTFAHSERFTLVIIFYTPDIEDKKIFHLIKFNLRSQHTIAIKTSHIFNESGLLFPGISLMGFSETDKDIDVVVFDKFKDRTFPEFAELKLSELVKGHARPKMILNFIDPTITNIFLWVRGIQNALGKVISIFGYSVLEESGYYRENPIYYNGSTYPGSVISVLFGEGADWGFSQNLGVQPLGKTWTATKHYENLLQELNGVSPLEIYKSLGIGEKFLNKNTVFPYAGVVYPPGFTLSNNSFCIRNVIKVMSDDTLFFNANVENVPVRLFTSSRELLLKTFVKTATSIKRHAEKNNREITAGFLFSSFACNRIVGLTIRKLFRNVKTILGETVPLVGIETFKEISPDFIRLEPQEPFVFQNNSISLLTIEKPL